MATVLIGYDLNRPGQDYSELFDAIKAQSILWWHHLDSTWIITTNKSCNDIRDALKPHIDANDELLVAKLTGEAAWTGFNADGSKWLKDNL